MAKQSQDREDLLRDGTAMTERGRLLINDLEVVIGFRPNGQLSLYWDQDPVFQFDSDHRLRRAFIDGIRYKSDQGRLVRMTKPEPRNSAVPSSDTKATSRLTFQNDPLSDVAESLILQRLADCLQQIESALNETDNTSTRFRLKSVGVDEDEFRTRVRKWTTMVSSPIKVASEPSA